MITGGAPGRAAWVPDERAGVGRENLDPAHVARYDDKEDARAAAEVAYLRAAGLGPDAVVVDLGAGTGQFALLAAEAFGRVVAVDPSPVMLARLRDKARAARTPPEVVEGGFLTYEHAGAPPDLVYSRYALHHLPDFWKAVALGRIRAMLRPGGLLRLWDVAFPVPLGEVAELIAAWRASVPEAAGAGDWVRADVDEHLRDEHSTFTWLLEPMFAQAGFAVRDADHVGAVDARYLLAAV